LQTAPLVTVVIPTLSGGPHLAACLGALRKQTFSDFEIVIINNGNNSLDEAVGADSRDVRIVAPGSNLGFGGAINLAIRISSTPFVATLNDDAEPDPAWLEALLSEMEKDPATGMCASKVRLSESGLIDSAGMLICLDGSSKQRGWLTPADSFSRSEDCLLPSACAALYRRKMLEEIGLFDQDYFLYCEDTDLGLRARWAGWRCRYCADATVRHAYSQTAGAISTLKARLVERNRLWVAVKTFPIPTLCLIPLFSLIRYFAQLCAVLNRNSAASKFVRNEGSLANAAAIIIRAHWETLVNLPFLLRKRSEVQRTRRIHPSEFLKLMYQNRVTLRELGKS
jgi:GT2 family glycosyltransferase